MIPADVEALLTSYLAALADPAAGEALYALHDPDASLFVDGRPGSPSAAEFSASHAVARPRAGFPAGPATLLAYQDGVLAFEVAGVRAILGVLGGRVAFCTVGDWSDFQTARARELMAFPSLDPAAGDRGWLDVAYRRAYHPERPPLLTLAGERFACHGSTGCCKVGEAVVPPEAQAFVDAVPWERIAPELAGTQLPVRPDGQLVVKGAHEACRFLDPAGRCRIHGFFGEPVFTPCVVFPYRFTETPDGVAVTTSYQCGSVRGALGPELSERPEELVYRYNRAGANFRLDRPRLRREGELDWPAYQAAEADLLAIPDLPLHRQLWMGARALEARLAGLAPDPDAALLEPLAPSSAAERKTVEATLGYTVGTLAMLYEFEPVLEISSIHLPDEPELRRWFKTILFAKDLANEFGLVTAHALLAHTYVFLLTAGAVPRDALYRAFDQRLLVPTLHRLIELVPVLADELDDPAATLRLLRYVQTTSRTR